MAKPGETPVELQTDTLSPYDQKQADLQKRTLVCVPKAYQNEDFLMSREGRTIRIICEFEETLKRLRANEIEGTFLFFGSARAMYRSDWDLEMKFAKEKLAKATDDETRQQQENKLIRLRKTEWLCEYMEKAEELSRRLTVWAKSEQVTSLCGPDAPKGGNALRAPNLGCLTEDKQSSGNSQHFVVSTGGGPGLMEAANRGADKVPGARSAGFAISLPFEKGLNPYVTPELAFTFHYFFTRKYWMLYPCKALIACPGGFGTFDELFESVTLKQTGKKAPFPIVLIGKDYWRDAINWKFLADKGVISPAEVDSMLFTDDIDEAFDHITSAIIGQTTGSPKTGPSQPPPAKKRRTGQPVPIPEAMKGRLSPLSRPADV